MRTNIDIDEKLMQQTMRATGRVTKKAAVEEAMRIAVQLHKQGEAIGRLWGLGWEGNLNATRRGKHIDWDRDWKVANKNRRKSAA